MALIQLVKLMNGVNVKVMVLHSVMDLIQHQRWLLSMMNNFSCKKLVKMVKIKHLKIMNQVIQNQKWLIGVMVQLKYGMICLTFLIQGKFFNNIISTIRYFLLTYLICNYREGFNYGFKVRDKREEVEEEPEIKGEPIPDDAYLMVSQLHWEDDVVWDGNDIKHKVLQKLNSKTNAAGWLPSSGSRTAGAFSQPGKGMPNTPIANVSTNSKSNPSGSKMSKGQLLLQKMEEADDTWYSIFPVENEELIYSKWEDEVIWDAEEMSSIPKPKILSLDPNDENIILGIPDDIDPSKIVKNTRPPPKVKIPHPHVKKSKILLGKAGVINVLAEDTPPPPPKSPDRDPFNISNDT